jgi:uncharacterized membrane protein YsdA (DUF1294 family)
MVSLRSLSRSGLIKANDAAALPDPDGVACNFFADRKPNPGRERSEAARTSPVNVTPFALAAACYYAAVTVVTFALYAWDKHAARGAGARVRERTLHLWAWLGGFLGALAGQQWLRHKSLRPAFAFSAWLALGLHAAGWAWWLTKQ